MALKPVIGGPGFYSSSTYSPAQFATDSAASPAAGTFTKINAGTTNSTFALEIGNPSGPATIRMEGAGDSFTYSSLLFYNTAGVGWQMNFRQAESNALIFYYTPDGSSFNPVLKVTANGTLKLLNTSTLGSASGCGNIGSLSGVMSVINDGESAALPLSRILLGSATWTTGTIPANSSANQTVSVTGAKIGSPVVMNYTADLLTFFQNPLWDIEPLVVGADTVQLTVRNADPINSNPLGAIALSFSVFQ